MIAIPIWAAVAAVPVVVIAVGMTVAVALRGRAARRLVGPWILDRRPAAPAPARLASVTGRDAGRGVAAPSPVRVIPAAHEEEDR